MIRISLVPTDELCHVWYFVEPMIDRALQYSGGRFRTTDVYRDIVDGTQTLWVALDDGEIIGCTTISVTQYPGLKALVYEHLAGKEVDRWLGEGHRVCSKYAKAMGCDTLECQGRSGWKPFLEKLGYRQFAVRYECKLED